MPASDEALWFRFTIRRPPNCRRFQSPSTVSLSGPSNPTIITAPISSSSVRPDGVGGARTGDGGAGDVSELGAGEQAASRAAASSMGTRRLTTTRLRGAGFPARAQLGDDRVDGVDELMDLMLAHGRRDGAHPARRHQNAVVDEPEEKVTRP